MAKRLATHFSTCFGAKHLEEPKHFCILQVAEV